jgi:hypothetical protein
VLSIPAHAAGSDPTPSQQPGTSDQPPPPDPRTAVGAPSGNDPLGLDDFDEQAFGDGATSALPSSTLAAPAKLPTPARTATSSSGSGNKGLIIGVIIGGVAVFGVLAIVVLVALLLPAIRAAREAAERVRAESSTRADASASGTESTSDAWIRYDWPADGYSVLMPRQPQRQSQSAMGSSISIAVCDLGPQGAYFVATTRQPPLRPDQVFDAEAALEGGVNGAVNGMNGELLSKKTINMGGHPGREFTFRGKKGNQSLTGHSRLYVVNTVIYQTMFLGTDDVDPGADLTRFFDSFKLLSPPEEQEAEQATANSGPNSQAPAGNVPAKTNPAAKQPAITPESSKANLTEILAYRKRQIYQALNDSERFVERLLEQAEQMEERGQSEPARMLREQADRVTKQNDERIASNFGLTVADLQLVKQHKLENPQP